MQLVRIIAFVTVLAPCVADAQYRQPDYPAYVLPPYAPAYDGRMSPHDADRYREEMERRHEYEKRQFDSWREYQEKQREALREYREKQKEAWRENRKRQLERWREFQEGNER